jgi:glycosyltransferase involved in cell wall biosynthesis
MNILLLNWRDTKNQWGGGAEIYVEELAKRWAAAGHKVTFFCGQNYQSNLLSEEDVDGIHIVRRGGRFTLYIWAAWYYLTKFRNNCDVIVDAINGVPFFTPLYSKKPIVALMFHVHDVQFFIELPFPFSVIGFMIEKYLLPRVYSKTQVVAISQTTKRDSIQLGFQDDKISIVYPGLNFTGKSTFKKYSSPTILYLGKIKKYKRVNMLIKFMPEILAKVPNARLLIAGWGSDGPYLTDEYMKSDLRKKIKIVGPVSEAEKKELMAKSWVCVNPSLHEGWGIPVIEANYFGTPTVAFSVPGLSESIQHGKTGMLAESNTDFVNNVVKVLSDKKLRTKLSKNSKVWANHFRWDNSAKEFLKVIKSQYVA